MSGGWCVAVPAARASRPELSAHSVAASPSHSGSLLATFLLQLLLESITLNRTTPPEGLPCVFSATDFVIDFFKLFFVCL